MDANQCSQLGHCEKKRGSDIPGLTDTTGTHCLGPKQASRICKLFSLYKETVCCKKAPKQRLETRNQSIQSSTSHYSTCPPTQTSAYIALWKQHNKKSKEEAAEYAKLLAKRMKEAKENTRTRLPRALRASTSESSQKEDCLRVTNK